MATVEEQETTTFPGLYRGIVRRINDPQKKNRIVVVVPAVNGDGELDWALPCFPVHGKLRKPQPGEPVWVAFEHGDIDFPVWIGSWLGAGEEQSGSLGARKTATYTTAGGSQELGTVALGLSYRVLQVHTSGPARVRLYASVADQQADVSRGTLTPPPAGLGLVLDVLTSAEVLTLRMSPQADGSSLDSPASALIPVTVTPTENQSVTVTMTYLRTE